MMAAAADPSPLLVTTVLAVHVKVVGVILLPLLHVLELALILRDSIPASRPELRAVRPLLLPLFAGTAEHPEDEIRPSSCLLPYCEEIVADDDDGAAWELRRRPEEKFMVALSPCNE